MAKRVAVIGAGASGLVGIKCLVDEGLEPVCFERTTDIGGLWNYTDQSQEGQACVMKTTVINTSKEMMCYSDFPIPDDYPNFMHNSMVQEYFKLYLDHFGLGKYIRFQTSVLSVDKAESFAKDGKWVLKIKNLKDGSETTETFDAVLVCTGHHAEKNTAHFQGIETFEGKIVHTHDYKDHRGYEDKRVVVVGIGNSGGDVATELGKVSKQVFLSTRRGSWVINRIAESGHPADMLHIKRVSQEIVKLLPRNFFNFIAESRLNNRFDHCNFGLKPEHRFDSQHPMVNDDLPNRIICGAVVVKPNIKRISKRTVEFEDGSVVEDIDAIIMATGYKFGFPFIDKSVIEVKNNKVELYKYCFPPRLEQPSMAVIGFIQPWGAIMPIAELQCRWAARVFKGVQPLPSKEVMMADIRKKACEMESRYVESTRHTIQVDWIPFMDELAEHVGCKPNIWEIFKQDPRLGWELFFGTCTPYQYRIQGPGKWSGARQALMTQWDRVMNANKRGKVVPRSSSGSLYMYAVAFIVLAFLLYIIF